MDTKAKKCARCGYSLIRSEGFLDEKNKKEREYNCRYNLFCENEELCEEKNTFEKNCVSFFFENRGLCEEKNTEEKKCDCCDGLFFADIGLYEEKKCDCCNDFCFESKYFCRDMWEEYEDIILVFEGEYLNDQRNGKGKEYNDEGNVIYEGDYLNGERNGKGKEYNDNDKLIFEGEYLNGKRWKRK